MNTLNKIKSNLDKKKKKMFLVFIISGLFTIPFASCGICDGPYNFTFPTFDSTSCGNGGNLNCMGAVNAINGTLTMTPHPDEMNEIARVLYRYPVLSWPASICTTFTIRILIDQNAPTKHGDGMSFIMAQDSSPSPRNSFGAFLGIFDDSTEGKLHQTAFEFDTYKNEFEADGNHIAIDTTSIEIPVAYKSLDTVGINLVSGKDITVRIEYDGWTKNFEISVGYGGPENLKSFLNHTMKLKHTVPESIYVGFTAATGPLSETHQVLSWNFTSILLPKSSLGANNNSENNKLLIIVVPVAFIGFSMLTILAFYPFILRYQRRKKERLAKKGDIESFIAVANGPKFYSYRKLSRATRNFSKDNLLGTGGFGSVYKGVLSDSTPTTMAVKKISSTSTQGEKEYLAEICTIGRLRHKNLVQLQGWCHDRNHLLLVYEYMANGSLDRFIGKGNYTAILDWPTRHKILLGLASALLYLHEECGNPVVHRDVKPNNVMLDSNFNAYLGDFGLARLIQNEVMATTMIAGTPGYLAPEVSFTGRATPESDVYSFGMVVLELVCGKRSKGMVEEDSLVDTVWNFYEKETLLECVDKLLQGQFDEEQVKKTITVGLTCLHPDLMLRPKMRKVVQMLMNIEESVTNVPKSRPLSVCLSLVPSSSTSSTTEFGSRFIHSASCKESCHDDDASFICSESRKEFLQEETVVSYKW